MSFLSATLYEENSDLFYGTYTNNYIIRWAFQNKCHHVFDPRVNEWPTNPNEAVTFNPSDVKAGDVIFVRDVPKFFQQLHPFITKPYLIVTAGEYLETTDPQLFTTLDDPMIIAWFSIHACRETHPKFYKLPLGIYQNKKYYEPTTMTQYLANLRKVSKSKLLYLNFDTKTDSDRTELISLFKNEPFCYSRTSPLPFLDYLNEMAEFKFTLAPHGLGPDTYRNYEAMLVGSIPIIKSSQLDDLYDDLPALIIKGWEEVTEEFLERKYREITSKKYNIEKLFLEYWWKEIEDIRQQFLEKVQ